MNQICNFHQIQGSAAGGALLMQPRSVALNVTGNEVTFSSPFGQMQQAPGCVLRWHEIVSAFGGGMISDEKKLVVPLELIEDGTSCKFILTRLDVLKNGNLLLDLHAANCEVKTFTTTVVMQQQLSSGVKGRRVVGELINNGTETSLGLSFHFYDMDDPERLLSRNIQSVCIMCNDDSTLRLALDLNHVKQTIGSDGHLMICSDALREYMGKFAGHRNCTIQLNLKNGTTEVRDLYMTTNHYNVMMPVFGQNNSLILNIPQRLVESYNFNTIQAVHFKTNASAGIPNGLPKKIQSVFFEFQPQTKQLVCHNVGQEVNNFFLNMPSNAFLILRLRFKIGWEFDTAEFICCIKP